MAIPTFNDNTKLVDVREQSINPAISKVNELDTSVTDLKTRLGVTPHKITDLDEVLPSGWYHFTPSNKSSATKGEGFVQFYTVTSSDGGTPVYARATFYPKNDSCKYYTREWGHSVWGNWVCIGQGGFRLEPNPPVAGENLFKAATRALAESARNTYFSNASHLTPYDDDTMLLIVLEWKEGAKTVTIFQSRSNNSWIEPFGELSTEFQLGNHDATELRDWSTWRDKINDSVHSLLNVGSSGVEVSSKTGDAISISKLAGTPFLSVTKKADQTIEFSAKIQWAGVYDTKEALESSVSSADCVENVTIAGVRDNSNGYNLHKWAGSGSGKGWQPFEVIGGGLYHSDDGHLKGYQYLKDGPNVVFSHASATGALQINLKDVVTPGQMGDYIKKGELESKPNSWTNIEQTGDKIQISSKPTVTEFKNFTTSSDGSILFGVNNNGGSDKVDFTVSKSYFRSELWDEMRSSGSDPIIKSTDLTISDRGTSPNKYINLAIKRDVIATLLRKETGSTITESDILKPSESIDVVREEDNGVSHVILKVKDSVLGKIQARVGTNAYQTVTKIDASKYGSVSSGTLVLPLLKAQGKSGTDLGEFSVIKQGGGLQFTNANGVLTINRTGVQAQVGDDGTAETLNKIIATNPYAEVNDGVLELPVITALDANGVEVSKVKNIKAGKGVSFQDTGSSGIVTISASGGSGRLSGKIGSTTHPIDTISLPDGGGVFKDSNSTLHINSVEGVVGGNTKVLKKIEVLQNTSGSSELDSTGKLTIKIPAQGGSGGTPLIVSGKTTDGSTISDAQVHKLTFGEGITFSETPADQEAKLTSLLEVTGKDLDEASKPTVTAKVTKVEFGDGLDTEIVTVEGSKSYARIKSLGNIQASASGGSKPIKMESVDQILVVGDASSSYTDNVSGKKQLTIEAYVPVLEEDSKTALITNHPPSDNTSRLGFTTDNETLYIGNSGQWKDLCYTGMGDSVKSLESRLPRSLEKAGVTYEEANHKSLKVTSISSSSAGANLSIPGDKEGVLIDMYAGDPSSEKGAPTWVQKYYTFDGDELSRCRGGTEGNYSWGSWYKTTKTAIGLEDNNYAVLIMDNDKKMSDLKNSQYQIPYLVHSDPTSNIRFIGDDGSFQVTKEGQYDVTCIALFTSTKDVALTDGGPAYIEIRKSSAPNNPIANVDFEKNTIYDSTEKEFYPIKGTFKGVALELGETYSVRVAVRNMSDADMAKIEYDPYKNILAIDPSNSRTKTAAGIQKTLFRTMGGLSFSAGAEVRTELSGSTIRVYGQKYLTEIKEQQFTIAEV